MRTLVIGLFRQSRGLVLINTLVIDCLEKVVIKPLFKTLVTRLLREARTMRSGSPAALHGWSPTKGLVHKRGQSWEGAALPAMHALLCV
eukprot:scaffold111055_cov21-Tisochrysis_lutea.AAC.1